MLETPKWVLLLTVLFMFPVIVFCLLFGACGVAVLVGTIGRYTGPRGEQQEWGVIGLGIAIVGFGIAVGLIILAIKLFRNRL